MGFWMVRSRKCSVEAVVGALAFLLTTASAAEAVPVSLPVNAVINSVGQTTVVDITIGSVSNVEGLGLSLTYSEAVADVMNVQAVQRGPLTQNCDSSVINIADPGRVTITAACFSTPVAGSGTLFSVTFTGIGNGVSPLTFSTFIVMGEILIPNGCLLNEGVPSCEPMNGQLTVGVVGPTSTASATRTSTATRTPTNTVMPVTGTATRTPTNTVMPIVTGTATNTPVSTSTRTNTVALATATNSATGTSTATITITPTVTDTPTTGPSPTASNTTTPVNTGTVDADTGEHRHGHRHADRRTHLDDHCHRDHHADRHGHSNATGNSGRSIAGQPGWHGDDRRARRRDGLGAAAGVPPAVSTRTARATQRCRAPRGTAPRWSRRTQRG